ncbi:MAG: hypothetical protein NVS9B1_17690 [Candidatus Dormibacteraceae bacterium]
MTVGPGSQLGAYQIVEEVGRGGMGTVYRAKQPALERDVAVKVLPDQLAAEPGFRDRFRQEAVVVARLRHPNIVAVHDFGEQDGVSYLVTEFIEGTTLDGAMGAPLGAEATADLLGPIAEALDHAHANGILHRDVKPSNIFINRQGSPVLGDFGLARMASADARLTQTGMVIGTPAYMAPEQCEGAEVGPETDVYALATIAYQLLTGALPFDAPTPMRLMLTKIDGIPARPTVGDRPLPIWLEAALMKGLANRRQDRYPTAAGLVRALRPLAPPPPAVKPGRAALVALLPALAAGALLTLALVMLGRIVPVPMTAGTFADVPIDDAGIHLRHDATAYPVDLATFHPALTNPQLVGDRRVDIWTDPNGSQVIAMTLYDENNIAGPTFTTAAYDGDLAATSAQETQGAAAGIAAAVLLVVAAILFILVRRRSDRPRSGATTPPT